jgi:hypothetical protein
MNNPVEYYSCYYRERIIVCIAMFSFMRVLFMIPRRVVDISHWERGLGEVDDSSRAQNSSLPCNVYHALLSISRHDTFFTHILSSRIC